MTMGEVSGVPSNLGSVVNKGFEVSLNWKSRIGKDFSYYAGVNFSYNKNRVTKFKGDLVKRWTDGVYSNNLSDVTAGYGSGKLCEGHALGEHYLRRLYKGNGRGYRGGAVDVNAGPKDGMIRTQQDFEWVQAMLETGYTFNGVTALSKDQLWYGDLIYADLTATATTATTTTWTSTAARARRRTTSASTSGSPGKDSTST